MTVLQARGYRGQTMLDIETTYGVIPATKAAKILPFISNEVAISRDLKDSDVILNTRNASEPYAGNESADGDVKVPLDLRAAGWWLRVLMGAPTTTVVTEGSLYKHVFKVQESLPSFVLQRGYQDVGKYFIYTGCRANSLALPFGGDSEPVATINVMGSKETVQTAAYDTAATVVKLNQLSQFQASVKIGGAESKIIKSGNLTIDNGLDGDQRCIGDGGVRSDIPEGTAKPSGDLSALFTDTTWLDKAKNMTKDSLELIYTKDLQSISFLFPEILWQLTSPTITGKGGVLCNLKWQGFYDTDANASAAVVTLTNDVASYA